MSLGIFGQTRKMKWEESEKIKKIAKMFLKEKEKEKEDGLV